MVDYNYDGLTSFTVLSWRPGLDMIQCVKSNTNEWKRHVHGVNKSIQMLIIDDNSDVLDVHIIQLINFLQRF